MSWRLPGFTSQVQTFSKKTCCFGCWDSTVKTSTDYKKTSVRRMYVYIYICMYFFLIYISFYYCCHYYHFIIIVLCSIVLVIDLLFLYYNYYYIFLLSSLLLSLFLLSLSLLLLQYTHMQKRMIGFVLKRGTSNCMAYKETSH